ncbi:MAG TPA: LCP family protein [Solirubrobacteraceae bacterium]|nr:LCP family protein [Solirubrobacteraceae bacterium]
MTPTDSVISRVSATNPVPDPEVLTAEQRASAETLRAAITASAAGSAGTANTRPGVRGRARLPRRIWPAALAVASIVPVVAVVFLVLGVHHRTRGQPSRGSSSLLRLPVSGKAQTLLLIGSDHRAGESYRFANTDAMLLVRVNPDATTVNVLSVPRDLLVRIPGSGTGKLNAVYGLGGPATLLKVLRTQVFPGLQVNHIIDLNFQGFSAIVDALGCVYGDVDHRYINDTAQTGYSSIDLQAGYQKLCGTQALQFVRFRHTDSDLVREARQRDFLRWAGQSVSLGTALSTRDRLLQIVGRYGQVDHGLQSADAVITLFNLVLNSAGHPLQQIPFPARLSPCDGTSGCGITATRSAEAAAYARFLSTGVHAARSSSASATSSGSPSAHPPGAGRVVADAAAGRAQAGALGSPGLPVYYPQVIAADSTYCSTATGNCRVAPNGAARYVNAYPRAYAIAAAGHHRYPSYRMTLVANAALGEYYGIQGTTWPDPPILARPAAVVVVNGRRLREYGSGANLSLVAFRTPTGTYWVSNTLTDSIPSGELVSIAASMQPAS